MASRHRHAAGTARTTIHGLVHRIDRVIAIRAGGRRGRGVASAPGAIVAARGRRAAARQGAPSRVIPVRSRRPCRSHARS
jgi:hypothetical protein